MTASVAPKAEVPSALSGLKIAMKHFAMERSVFNRWAVTVPADMPYAQLFDPACWNHVARQLRPQDTITVNAEDGSYNAELIVRDCGDLYARVAELRCTVFKEVVEVGSGSLMPACTVQWSGPHAKWRVIRMNDKAVLQEGLSSKGDAERWLQNHIKPVA